MWLINEEGENVNILINTDNIVYIKKGWHTSGVKDNKMHTVKFCYSDHGEAIWGFEDEERRDHIFTLIRYRLQPGVIV
jgi:hypothetical protein